MTDFFHRTDLEDKTIYVFQTGSMANSSSIVVYKTSGSIRVDLDICHTPLEQRTWQQIKEGHLDGLFNWVDV